ncbi:MAG: hypothetical protein P4L84_27355 [Isosphaeraceae bacterium]|nr:hypothetical protein [Isosphaeraceae bacterium]
MVGPDSKVIVRWPISPSETGVLELDPIPGEALIESLSIVADANLDRPVKPLLKDVDPVTFLTVGTRVGTEIRPPSMSVFNTFFDTPANRPHQTYRARLEAKRVEGRSTQGRYTAIVHGLRAGPFAGSLEITVYPGSPLVHIEAVLSTEADRVAYLYDMGLVASGKPSWNGFSWTDTEGNFQTHAAQPTEADRPLAVRHRTLIAEGANGSVACFPPPHQYFFARDLTDNLKYVWFGAGHRGLAERNGFGIRQSETGGGAWVPWVSAPPKTEQRLGMFLLASPGRARETMNEVLRYTHGDRFPDLPGHVTFSSHWHMAIALAAMKEIESKGPRTTPDLVKIFKDMNVNIVHLGEFHGDGHPRDQGPLRLAELDALFAECRRLSGDKLLLVPGEEANAYLGLRERGKEPGHWMLLFPRPVYWTMVRGEGQPFSESHPRYGTVFHVGSRDDMSALLDREHGLAWTAHPRIKASSWTPDGYKDEPFFKADTWLGAAWKGMPADLSQPRLGTRALDLMDDMANWGQHKYVPGEVDVFKIDHTHELYGHMNVNYVRLDRIPRFDDGWQPLLDALREGKFFVTTGEVLARGFTVSGKSSGETLTLPDDGRPELKLDLEWTFPLKFAEVVSGDGRRTYRERIDLADTAAFGQRELRLKPELKGRTWVRVEAWDVAANGTFTQPVWLETR